MNRRRALLAVSAALVLALAPVLGCTKAGSTPERVARDLKNYMSTLKGWEEEEKSIFVAISEVERSQYVDDEFVIRRLKGALPDVEQHIREMGAYHPDTLDVSAVHDHARRAWEDLRTGMQSVIATMEAKDYVRLAGAKGQVESARNELLEAFRQLDGLLEEHDEQLKNLQKS
jgi:hypothetical protein